MQSMSRRNSLAGGSALAITVALAAAGALLPMVAQAGDTPLPSGTITSTGSTVTNEYYVDSGTLVTYAANYGTINANSTAIEERCRHWRTAPPA
jgi:hypothetical protein